MMRFLIICAVLLTAAKVSAQSSINTFSPFTLYGVGDLRGQGVASKMGMGGVGAADRGVMNVVNPASLSAMPRKTFHFNFGIDGSFHYLKEGDKKTSFNTFNIKDIVLRMPLGKGLGFGASLSPYSSVGYRIVQHDDNPANIAAFYPEGGIGTDYTHKGAGDISQARFSLGWEPVKRLSIGVDMIYYFGDIERTEAAQVLTTASDAYIPVVSISHLEEISRIQWGFGAQYNLIEKSRQRLTLGATYLPGGALKAETSVTAVGASSTPQSLTNTLGEGFKLPKTFSLGAYYQTWRLGAGIDYEYQGWSKANADRADVSFRNTNAVRAGFEFTPSRHDVRNPLKRVTYRLGVRTGDYYMNFGGKDITERAVTAGLGIPLKTDRESYLDIGLEYGSRGAKETLKEDFFRVSVGFRLWGAGWFQKMMYM